MAIGYGCNGAMSGGPPPLTRLSTQAHPQPKTFDIAITYDDLDTNPDYNTGGMYVRESGKNYLQQLRGSQVKYQLQYTKTKAPTTSFLALPPPAVIDIKGGLDELHFFVHTFLRGCMNGSTRPASKDDVFYTFKGFVGPLYRSCQLHINDINRGELARLNYEDMAIMANQIFEDNKTFSRAMIRIVPIMEMSTLLKFLRMAIGQDRKVEVHMVEPINYKYPSGYGTYRLDANLVKTTAEKIEQHHKAQRRWATEQKQSGPL